MRYESIDPALFQLNRRRFARRMMPESMAIFHSNDLMPRSGDTCFPFRQNSDLFFLCGLDQEETVLVLFPDCVKEGFQEIAFIKRSDERSTIWEGKKLSKEEARARSGLEKIYWLDEMEPLLTELILLAKRVYLNLPENERFQLDIPSRDERHARELMRRFPLHKYHRAQPIIKKLAMIKSPFEVDLIRKAIDITGSAFRRVLEFVRPGLMEYEIEAEITHEFIRRGANGHAYPPIVGSGANSCVLHYIDNNRPCADGDLLLLDFGAEYANYAADLSRTIPVNGRFTPRQKQVYQSVLKILKEARQMLTPGITLDEYGKEVRKLVESELLTLKLLDKTDLKQQDNNKPAYRKYFMHGVAHHLGLDVHDRALRYGPIQAGMVFTCEPGIYIQKENIGIRLENNILVTDQSPIDLMANIPIEAEDIEAFMNARVLN
jgi:Xaa-Pro aminopeptidase